MTDTRAPVVTVEHLLAEIAEADESTRLEWRRRAADWRRRNRKSVRWKSDLEMLSHVFAAAEIVVGRAARDQPVLEGMEAAARDIGRSVHRALPQNVGYFLMLFSFGEGGFTTYISNGQRDDVFAAFDELKRTMQESGS